MGSNPPCRVGTQCLVVQAACGMVAGAFLRDGWVDSASVISAWQKPECLGCIPQPHLGFGAGFVPPQLPTRLCTTSPSRQSQQKAGIFATGIFATEYLLFIPSKALWVFIFPVSFSCHHFSGCTDTPSPCSEHPADECPSPHGCAVPQG